MPPIKRHEALVHFSKEHYFGLMLGWKIKQGVKKNIQPERMLKYVLKASEAEVMPHFANEEKELFVLLDQKDPLRIQAEKEHVEIRQQLAGLKAVANVEKLEGFAKALEAHIRFEERQLFPHIEQQQSFEVYAKAMQAHEALPHEDFDAKWNDHFWR